MKKGLRLKKYYYHSERLHDTLSQMNVGESLKKQECFFVAQWLDTCLNLSLEILIFKVYVLRYLHICVYVNVCVSVMCDV